MAPDPQVVQRFWSYVDKSGDCWTWTRGKNRRGYGKFWGGYALGHTSAHRFSWLIDAGQPAGDMHVCHHCDNPSCVRPSHLFLGTAQDNRADCCSKGRQTQGEAVNTNKLRPDQVETIRELYATGRYTHRAIARVYGVSRSHIQQLTSPTCAVWKNLGA